MAAAVVGGGGTARNEAEKAHINNEMAQCSRGWGRERERRRVRDAYKNAGGGHIK